jgi:hypothetical protein
MARKSRSTEGQQGGTGKWSILAVCYPEDAAGQKRYSGDEYRCLDPRHQPIATHGGPSPSILARTLDDSVIGFDIPFGLVQVGRHRR